MRHNFVSGTHTLAAALFGMLRPGDTLLSLTGGPYDTMEEVIMDDASKCNKHSRHHKLRRYRRLHRCRQHQRHSLCRLWIQAVRSVL